MLKKSSSLLSVLSLSIFTTSQESEESVEEVVTVGTKAAELMEKWDKEDKYTDAYYLHGLAVETAEAMAEWINEKIKTDIRLSDCINSIFKILEINNIADIYIIAALIIAVTSDKRENCVFSL